MLLQVTYRERKTKFNNCRWNNKLKIYEINDKWRAQKEKYKI